MLCATESRGQIDFDSFALGPVVQAKAKGLYPPLEGLDDKPFLVALGMLRDLRFYVHVHYMNFKKEAAYHGRVGDLHDLGFHSGSSHVTHFSHSCGDPDILGSSLAALKALTSTVLRRSEASVGDRCPAGAALREGKLRVGGLPLPYVLKQRRAFVTSQPA